MAWAVPGKARPWATEVTFRGGAPLGAAVPAFALGTGNWHVPPGQGRELGTRAGLVALHRDHIVCAAPGQVAGVPALGVQRVGGDHRTGELDGVQQGGEQRDFAGLGARLQRPGTLP